MTRQLTPQSRLETLRKEAKRWLKSLRGGDPEALERLRRAHPGAGAAPTLREVQHALAREHGATHWGALKRRLEELALASRGRDEIVAELLEHGSLHYGVRPGTTEWDRRYHDHPSRWEYAARILARHPEVAGASLHAAAVCGDLAEALRILAARPSAAAQKGGREGWLPIDYLCYGRLPTPAAATNGVAIARALLDARPIPDAGAGELLLIGAIGGGENAQPPHPRARELAELLIERGADPYNPQVLYNVSLIGDDLDWYDFLYERSARRGETAKWTTPQGAWPPTGMLDYLLSNAVSFDSLNRARWLLARGADPRSRHFYSKRDLHTEALLHGHLEIAALLVEHGASAAPLEGHDAFHVAALRGDRETAARLAAAHPGYLRRPAPLLWAAAHDAREVAALLLDLGMSPDVADATNHRPLHTAAQHDAVGAATLLIDRGAAIDPVEIKFDATPLSTALFFGRERMIALLVPLSREPRALARAGAVARLGALFAEEPALASGALLFALPADEERALDVVELLLAHGVDPRATDAHGTTAAEHAEKLGFDAVADRLSED